MATGTAGDIDIDCNNCFNNRDFNGKINFNDVDWKNVDRDKIKIDRNQFNKIDRNEIKNKVKANGDNAIRDRAKDIKKRDQVANRGPGKTAGTRDVRKSTLDGLKGKGGQAATRPANKAKVNRPASKPTANRPATKPAKATRPAGKPKPAHKVDNRPKKQSGLGNVDRGKTTKVHSNRGNKSMGGGSRGGGAHKQVRRPSGGGGRGGGGGGRAALRKREDRIMTKMFSTHSFVEPSRSVCATAIALGLALSLPPAAFAQDRQMLQTRRDGIFALRRPSRRPSTRRRRPSTPSRRRCRLTTSMRWQACSASMRRSWPQTRTLPKRSPQIREGAAKHLIVDGQGDRRMVVDRRKALAVAVPGGQGRGRQMGLRHLCRT